MEDITSTPVTTGEAAAPAVEIAAEAASAVTIPAPIVAEPPPEAPKPVEIVPSVGRIVLYSEQAEREDGTVVLVTRPAIVIDVHSAECITLQAFFAPWDRKKDGVRTSVLIDAKGANDRSWRWMPYQLGQAAIAKA